MVEVTGKEDDGFEHRLSSIGDGTVLIESSFGQRTDRLVIPTDLILGISDEIRDEHTDE